MENEFGVFVGRFSPLHIWHQYVIDYWIKRHWEDNFLLFIGSQNIEANTNNIFDFEKRKSFIKNLYPKINIIWLDDYPDDNKWQKILEKEIFNFFGIQNLEKVVFYTWAINDVKFFEKLWLNIKIIDRFSWPTKNISATKIRQKLKKWETIEKLVDRKIIKLIQEE